MALCARLRSAVALAGRYPLLAGVDLDVSDGEVLVVRGPNGAGKTSLLRVLAGLQPLSDGQAEVLGLDPTADARRLRPLVGLLGHQNGLYDDLSAQQNVQFTVSAARAPRSAASEALARTGLVGRLAGLPVSKLSAGQRRRVAIASLLARRPRLWLLDEPHAGLDAEHRQLLDEVLVEVSEGGATVVLASHEHRDWDALGARCVSMSGGTMAPGAVVEAVPDVAEVPRAPSQGVEMPSVA